jgi:anti-sigma regulatory factor (Ser/Thr protein kinase)
MTEADREDPRAGAPDADVALGGTVPAAPWAIPDIRHRISAFAAARGASAQDVTRIELAVTEAVTNVVVHAYPDGPGRLHFAVDAVDGDIQILVVDQGAGMRPGRSEGLGLGLGIIAGVTDDLQITERDPHGLELWMRFVLAGADGEPA